MYDETSNPSSLSEGHIMPWMETRKCCRENVTAIECRPFRMVLLMGQGKGGGTKVMPLCNMDNFAWWRYVIWVALHAGWFLASEGDILFHFLIIIIFSKGKNSLSVVLVL